MKQLSLNLDPIIETQTEFYKGWEIVANQRERKQIIREGLSKFYQQRYNQQWAEFQIDYYFETIIYKFKHPCNGQGICGQISGCWSLDIAIECTKKYIDNFYLGE